MSDHDLSANDAALPAEPVASSQAIDAEPAAPPVAQPVPATDSPAVHHPTAAPALDLDAIERDLADVEVALSRLDAGTYWVDEVSGEPISAERLAEHPTARRA